MIVSHGAFVDETFLVTKRAAGMHTMVDRVADFSRWTRIHVHVQKSEITVYDYARQCPLATDRIHYMGQPFACL